jgi:hypothetical protein
MRLAYREVWKVILDGKPLSQACAAVAGEIEGYYEYRNFAAVTASIQEETSQDLERLYSLAQQGHALTLELVEQAGRRPSPIELIQTLGKSLEEVDEQIRILGTTKDTLRPITATFRFGKENLQGWELLSLAQQTMQLYEVLARQARIMVQVLAVCIEELRSSVTTVLH